MFERKINSVDELPKLAEDLLAAFPDQKIYVLDAPMGMGKTTFVKTICETLFETEEVVSSPTFAIVNVYTHKNEDIFHFDFYRLENKEEALDIGFDDYLYSNSYCFIEWPDLIMDFLPEAYVHVKISGSDNETERFFTADLIQN